MCLWLPTDGLVGRVALGNWRRFGPKPRHLAGFNPVDAVVGKAARLDLTRLAGVVAWRVQINNARQPIVSQHGVAMAVHRIRANQEILVHSSPGGRTPTLCCRLTRAQALNHEETSFA